jgi:3-phenylpropionate/trans-cinnamate dioxygenase ferredoxin reductase subunit
MMSAENQSVVIIGAGECGARAAFALRENGHKGSITLLGAEPLHPYERPPLSKGGLAVDAEPAHVATRAQFADEAIDLVTSASVVSIDPRGRRVVTADGAEHGYDSLVIATGASPRRLPFAPQASRRIVTLRTHDDALAIRAHLSPGKHLAIIGGGFIGLELAATARRAGVAVTLVEGLPRILSRGVPVSIATRVSDRHVAEGVDLRCGVSITGVDENGYKALISLVDGSTIAADLVVVGVGASPNIALAEAAGLAIENGIAVDDRLRTSAEGIFAAGDCCSFPLPLYDGRRVRLEAWRNAHDHGNLVARNILGQDEPVSAVPWFWSDQYDLTLQVAGLAEGAAEQVTRRIDDETFIEFHLAPDGRLQAASGISRGNAIARDIRLAEMLIAKRAKPDPAALADANVKLKSLLG